MKAYSDTAKGGRTWLVAGLLCTMGASRLLASPNNVQQNYRWYNDDGNLTGATHVASENIAVTTYRRGENIRVRFSVANTAGALGDHDSDFRARLEYQSGSSWPAVPTGTGAPFQIYDSPHVGDAQRTTTARVTGSGGYVQGYFKDTGNQAPSMSLDKGKYSNFEYSIRPTDAAQSGIQYVFRISDDGAALNSYNNVARMTLIDRVNFSTASSSGSESSTSVSLQISLSGKCAHNVLVDYTVSGTATGGGVDHNLAAGSVTIPAGSLSASIPFTVNNDQLDEDNETVIVTLGTVQNAELGTVTQHTYTILDNDDPPTVSFDSAPYSVSESGGKITIPVRLSAPSSFEVSVQYATADGTAHSPTDYAATSGTLVWPAGSSGVRTFDVAIHDNTFENPIDLVFAVQLGSPTRCTIAGGSSANVTIIDDDEAPAVNNNAEASNIQAGSARLNGQVTAGAPAPDVTIYWGDSNGGTNPGNWHTNIVKGAQSGTFHADIGGLLANKTYYYRCYAVNTADDAWAPTTAEFKTEAADVAFAVSESAASEAVAATSVEISLSALCGADVTVNYTVAGTATGGGVDHNLAAGQVTIPQGDLTATIDFTVTDDALNEFDETVVITLTGANGANLGSVLTHTYTIQDDDDEPTVGFTELPFSVIESAGAFAVSVALSAESGKDVRIDYTTGNGTAIAPDDYVAQSGYLQWNAGETGTKTFNVPIVDDGTDDGDKTFLVFLQNPSNCTVSGASPETVTIEEDDFAPAIHNDDGATNVTQTTADLRCTLSTTGTAATVVTVFWGDADEETNVTAWTTNIVIASAAEGPFATNVTGLLANKEYFYRGFASNSAGTSWAPSTAAFKTEYAVLEFATASDMQSEALTSTNVTVTLSAASAEDVTADYSVIGGDAQNGGIDFTLEAGTLTIPAGSLSTHIHFEIVDDLEMYEGNEYFVVALSNITGAVAGDITNFTYTIVDNDEGGPAVDNGDGALDVQAVSATLTGNLTSTGTAPTHVWIYWGDENGLDDKDDWDAKVYMGVLAPGPFSTNLTTLIPATHYYYRCYASNAVDDVWALTVEDFVAKNPTVEFERDASSGPEGNTSVGFVVRLAPSRVSMDVHVDYTVVGGDAQGGSVDYHLPSGRATISAGSLQTVIPCTVIDDTLDEYNETILVRITNAVNADLAARTNHTYTIVDNDAPPTVSFSAPTYSVDEGAGAVTVQVNLSAVSGKDASIAYTTLNGSATAGADYTAKSGTFSWLAGESAPGSIVISIIDDDVDEPSESFTVRLSNPVNVTVAGGDATVTILDNDERPTVSNGAGPADVLESTATLRGALLSTGTAATAVSIYWGISDGGTDALAWGAQIPLDGVGLGAFSAPVSNLLANKTYYYRCFASSAAGTAWAPATTNFTTGPATIEFAATSGTGAESVTNVPVWITLSHASGQDATVEYTVVGGSATGGGEDYTLAAGMATVPAGETTTHFVLAIVDDGIHESNETVIVELRNPYRAVIGSKTNYTYTIEDDDIGLAQIENWPGATDISSSAARLQGRVVDTGGDDPEVTIYWGQSDGGTNAGLWAASTNIGSVGVAGFGANIGSLQAGATYHYRCYAVNDGGASWAPQTETFEAVDPPLALPISNGGFENPDDSTPDAHHWIRSGANLSRYKGYVRSGSYSMRYTYAEGSSESVQGDNMNVLRASWNGQYADGTLEPNGGIRPGFVLSGKAYTRTYVEFGIEPLWSSDWVFSYRFKNLDTAVDWMAATHSHFESSYQALAIGRADPLPTSVVNGRYAPVVSHDSGGAALWWLGWLASYGHADDVSVQVSMPRMYLFPSPESTFTFADTVATESRDASFGIRSAGGGAGTVLYGANTTNPADLVDPDWARTAWVEVSDPGNAFSIVSGAGVTATNDAGWQYAVIRFEPPDAGTYTCIVRVATTDPADRYAGGGTLSNGIVYEEYTLVGTGVLRPTVNNGIGVTDITATSATLNGELLDSGTSPATVRMYGGDNDGGTLTWNWDINVSFGEVEPGTFSTNFTGLAANTRYYYRCHAENAAGASWAPETICFTTAVAAVEFASSASSVPEYAGQAAIGLTLAVPSGDDVTVNWTVTGGNAVHGEDFPFASGSAVIPAGSTTAPLLFDITHDTKDEPDETVVLTLTAASGATLGALTEHTLTILDDDEPGQGQGYKVQQGKTEIPDGSTVVDQAIESVGSLDRAFVVLHDHYAHEVGQNRGVTAARGMCSAYLWDDGGVHKIRFTRGDGTRTVSVSWTLIECGGEEFKVYRGEQAWSGGTELYTPSLPPVEGEDCFAWVNGTTSDAANTTNINSHYFTADVDAGSQTQVNIRRHAFSADASGTLRWIVVEFDRSKIGGMDTGEVNVSTETQAAPLSFSIAGCSARQSLLLGQWRTKANNGLNANAMALRMVSDTQGHAYEHIGNSNNRDLRWYCIDFGPAAGGKLSGTIDNSGSTGWTTADQLLGSGIEVNSGWSFVTMTCGGTGTAFPRSTCRHYLSATDTLEIERDYYGQPSWIEWQVLGLPAAHTVGPIVSIGDAAVMEGDSGLTLIEFPVTLSEASGWDVEVDYSLSDGTATLEDNDYVDASGTLTIPAGQTTATLNIYVVGDERHEPAVETFHVHLANPLHAVMGRATAVGTIHDDDEPPTISIAAAEVTEGDPPDQTMMTVDVTLSAASALDVSVEFETASGSAQEGVDYLGTNGTLVIPAGSHGGQIGIIVLGDTLYESNETFVVRLSNADGGSIVVDEATCTILNDDPPPTVTFAGAPYTVDEGAGTVTIRVALDTASGFDASVTLSTENGTAMAGEDYMATNRVLTWLAGETGERTVVVTILDDTGVEGDETLSLRLSDASNCVIADPNPETLTILDDDFTISFDAQGGTTPAPGSKTVTFAAAYGTLATTTRNGYTFAGWWTAPGGAGSEVTAGTTVATAGNHTLYAKWTANEYTVAFDAQEGSAPEPVSKPVTFAAAYGALATTAREGYTFAGWWTAPGGAGSEVTADTTVVTAGNHTLYAKWTVNEYTLDVVSAHGNPVPSVGTHTNDYGMAITNRVEAMLVDSGTQYVCLGWVLEGHEPSAGDTNVFSMTVTNAAVLNWQWATNHWLAFEVAGNGTVDVENGWFSVDTNVTVTAIPDPYHHFTDWSGETNGAVIAGDVITVAMDQPRQITAHFVVNQYTLTFDSAGGSAVDAIMQDFGTEVTAPAPPTKEGRTFNGWDPAVPATMPAENRTLTAQWTVNTYTLTFDSAGGSEVSAITQDYGTEVTAPAPPTKEGRTFNGWDPAVPATMPAENRTLTAQWTVNTYTLTFDSAGGSEVGAITQDYGTEVTAPAPPTKEGHTFKGWAPEVPATMPAENQTLTAQWTLDNNEPQFEWDDDIQGPVLSIKIGETLTGQVLGYDRSPNAVPRILFETNGVSMLEFKDANALASFDRRFYRVVTTDQWGHSETNATIFVAHKRTLTAGAWHMFSPGVAFGDDNTLDSKLGHQLARGLQGNNEPTQADRLYIMGEGGDWIQCYLDTNGIWRDLDTQQPSTSSLASREGVWARRHSTGSVKDAIFFGPTHSEPEAVTFATGDWKMIAWPFPGDRREGDGVEKGWGFAAAGARRGTSWSNADVLVVGTGADARSYYLHTTGRWCPMGRTTPAADLTFRLGEAYYYLHRGTGMTWTAREVGE